MLYGLHDTITALRDAVSDLAGFSERVRDDRGNTQSVLYAETNVDSAIWALNSAISELAEAIRTLEGGETRSA